MTNQNLNMDIDSLLDGTLDDLADMPEFKPFPVGMHKCIITLEVKKVGDFQAVEVGLKAIETLELPAGSEETPVNPGDTTNVLYFLQHSNPQVAEMGQGKFKEMMKVFAAHFGAKSNRELIAEANNSEVAVVTNVRKNKDKTKSYTDIVSLDIV